MQALNTFSLDSQPKTSARAQVLNTPELVANNTAKLQEWPYLNVEELSTYYPNQGQQQSFGQNFGENGEPSTYCTINPETAEEDSFDQSCSRLRVELFSESDQFKDSKSNSQWVTPAGSRSMDFFSSKKSEKLLLAPEKQFSQKYLVKSSQLSQVLSQHFAENSQASPEQSKQRLNFEQIFETEEERDSTDIQIDLFK